MGWIGVDFDGTLAKDRADWRQGDLVEVGEPIWPMIKRVRDWLAAGRDVRIVTARASRPGRQWAIEDFCKLHLGCLLPVVAGKDYDMEELWDDRAVAVQRNVGFAVGFDKDGNVEQK